MALAREDLKEAERLSRVALDGLSARLGDEHPQTIEALNGLGSVLYAQERMETRMARADR